MEEDSWRVGRSRPRIVMRMNTYSHRRHLLILVSLIGLLFVLSSFGGSIVSDADSVDAQASAHNGAGIRSHKMTQSEMEDYKGDLGVRDSALNYNVLVDGRGTGKAPPTAEDYDSLVGSLNMVESVSIDALALPASYDLSTSPSFPAIGDQGSQGSCTAWAATYYAYGYMEAVDNGWTGAKSGVLTQLLSPAWTYNKVNGGIDGGSWEWDNMMVLKDWGAATMATMPYTDLEYTDWGPPESYREAPLHRILDAYHIPYVDLTTVDTVKTLITQGAPVTFGIDANEYNQAFADGGHVISSNEYNSRNPNHANTFVGFDDSITDDGEVGAFRVANSWGQSWGDSGYYWMTYEAFMEIGSWDLLDLNFIEDRADYSPSMVAVWHFSPSPTVDAGFYVGIGTVLSPVLAKNPYYWLSTTADVRFPEYMSIDITEFRDAYDAGTEDFYLSYGPTSVTGTMESLKIELFDTAYTPGEPTHSSGESYNAPQQTPDHIDVTFPRYSAIGVSEALDTTLTFEFSGDVQWVGVEQPSSNDGDALQSGNIANSESSELSTSVTGPARASFDWKVSSKVGGGALNFYVNGSAVGSINGDVDWTTETFELGAGNHALMWEYARYAVDSELDDCGWVDNIIVSTIDTVAPVADAGTDAEVVVGTTVTLDGSGSSDNIGVVNWTWTFADGGPRVLYGEAAQYTFNNPGQFNITLSIEDAEGNSDTDFVSITALSPPTAAFSISPETGDTVVIFQFDASGSSDLEDPVGSLQMRWDWNADGTWDTDWSYSFTEDNWFAIAGNYTVRLEIMDSDGLTDTAEHWVIVTSEVPEFPSLLLPTAGLAAFVIAGVFLMARRKADEPGQ